MKTSLLFLSTIFISYSSIAGTDIIYSARSSALPEVVVAGNIVFGSEGAVDARKVCFDKANNVFKTTIPAHTVETCSISALPLPYCTENSGSIISTTVPARELTAPVAITVKKCTRFDYSDSTRPKCVEYKNVEKQQPIDFTSMKYEVQLEREYYLDPIQYEERDMSICE